MKLLDADIELITTCSAGDELIVPDISYGGILEQMAEAICCKKIYTQFIHKDQSPTYLDAETKIRQRIFNHTVHITEYWWLKHNEPTTQE